MERSSACTDWTQTSTKFICLLCATGSSNDHGKIYPCSFLPHPLPACYNITCLSPSPSSTDLPLYPLTHGLGCLRVCKHKHSIQMLILLAFRIYMLNGHLPYFTEQDNPAAFSDSASCRYGLRHHLGDDEVARSHACLVPVLSQAHHDPAVLTVLSFHRFLTFSYLMAFNVAMIVFPENLSYDWQMGSIPLITSVRDHRNLLTLTIMAFISIICFKCRSLIFDMIKSIISLLNGNQEPKFLSKSCHSGEEADQVCRKRS